MAILRGLAIGFCSLALLMGLLWIGQGLGLIMWPSSSFMLADRQWAVNGAGLAAVSGLCLWLLRRWRV